MNASTCFRIGFELLLLLLLGVVVNEKTCEAADEVTQFGLASDQGKMEISDLRGVLFETYYAYLYIARSHSQFW